MVVTIMSYLSKGEGMDIEVSVGVFIFILVDEVHHFLRCAVSLFDAGFFAPHLDCVADGVVNILESILEGFAR